MGGVGQDRFDIATRSRAGYTVLSPSRMSPMDKIQIESPEHLDALYRRGLRLPTVAADLPDDAPSQVGALIDASEDLGRPDGLTHALRVLDALLDSALDPRVEATLHYFAANAHSALWAIERTSDSSLDWRWVWSSPHTEQVVLSYRRAIVHPGFGELDPLRRCEIHTNLGNTFSTLGLSLEALAQYDAALGIDPSFGMARGNRGQVEDYLASTLYTHSHQWAFAGHAFADLDAALTPNAYPLTPDARKMFVRIRDRLAPRMSKAGGISWNPYEPSLGDTPEERRYRAWCLERRLFLNPYNDLVALPLAASDSLLLPPLEVPIGEGPKYHGAFNQLKQGFASARYLLYEGATDRDTHPSDRRVALSNTFDYPVYGYGIERIKMAYRSLYGLFDQIAFLLNDFLDLGIKPGGIQFRTLWYEKRQPKRGVRSDLADRQSGPLHALFWLGKDLYENREGFIDALDPEAQRLGDLRNHLEHRYLKVLEHVIPDGEDGAHPSLLRDDLAYTISRRDLVDRAVRLAQTARAAILYLALAMHVENVNRTRERGERVVPSSYLGLYEDDWKRPLW